MSTRRVSLFVLLLSSGSLIACGGSPDDRTPDPNGDDPASPAQAGSSGSSGHGGASLAGTAGQAGNVQTVGGQAGRGQATGGQTGSGQAGSGAAGAGGAGGAGLCEPQGVTGCAGPSSQWICDDQGQPEAIQVGCPPEAPHCLGEGECVACLTDSDCAAPDCQLGVCAPDHTCSTTPAAAGTPCATGSGFCSALGTCGVCLPGQTQCTDGGHQSSCTAGGQWSEPVTCGGRACGLDSGQCVGVEQVSVHSGHACAVLSDGTVRCWGSNTSGQLGPAPIAGSPFRLVPGLTDAVKVTTGADFSCALTKTGAIWCWGATSFGQLGSLGAVPGKVQKVNEASYVDLASGRHHSCAVTSQGRVECWGDNGDFQSGYGPQSGILAPLEIERPGGKAMTGARRVVVGDAYSCAQVSQSGLDAMVCWGTNKYKQLGDVGASSPEAIEVSEGLGTKPIERLMGSSRNAGYVFLDAGLIRSWVWGPAPFLAGTNLLDVTAQPWFSSPVPYEPVLGNYLSAVVVSGQVILHGSNKYAGLGNGKVSAPGTDSMEDSVVMLPGVDHAALGSQSVCAWHQGGEVWCWGNNAGGVAAPGSKQSMVLKPTLIAW